MSEFFSMGGYAAFVWSAYGVAAVVMITMLVASLHGLRRQQRAVRLLEEARGQARSDRRQRSPADAMPESGQ